MRAMMARLGDAMLQRVLPTAEAGACVSVNGQPCRCGSPCFKTYCHQYRYDCNGDCKYTSQHC
jgi:hypothetical protein